MRSFPSVPWQEDELGEEISRRGAFPGLLYPISFLSLTWLFPFCVRCMVDSRSSRGSGFVKSSRRNVVRFSVEAFVFQGKLAKVIKPHRAARTSCPGFPSYAVVLSVCHDSSCTCTVTRQWAA